MNEVWKSVRGLVDHLYSQPGIELKPAFIALDILCLACYHGRSYHARERILTYKGNYACEQHPYFRFARCVARCESPLEFFNHIYPDPPDPDFTFLLDSLIDPMRNKAVQHLRKAYYSVSKAWAARWLGVSAVDEKETSKRIMDFVNRYSGEGGCTEDENGMFRFSRIKTKTPASTSSPAP
ncbi:hypothetical protein BCR43DRAFT_493826 [Syncephalastrum racemosum]|uniref:CSN8/PSMD8/EIF3K domain-containing protein n=1 Tax=Syncephalastrum racemosum TaxID=13706 RepID=A0A1X2HB96_SYNRA|nr:hypothetical protein BCR43DRAFT_493826 [Syncephalastrum racemosum]